MEIPTQLGSRKETQEQLLKDITLLYDEINSKIHQIVKEYLDKNNSTPCKEELRIKLSEVLQDTTVKVLFNEEACFVIGKVPSLWIIPRKVNSSDQDIGETSSS